MRKKYFLNFGFKIALGFFVLFLIFYTGFFLGEKKGGKIDTLSALKNTELNSAEIDFSLFWKAWKLLDEKYIDNATSTEEIAKSAQNRLWGAISGMTNSLGDPFTIFLPPEENEYFAIEISGSFEGVGMEIGSKDGELTVIAPLKNTPAYKAGILPGDKIIKIDDQPTINVLPEQAVKMIRGPKGSAVILTIFREGKMEPFEISITRDTIQIPTIDTEIKQSPSQGDGTQDDQNSERSTLEDIFIIRLYNFSEPSAFLFQQKLREFAESKTDKLILDLRGNPGGYLGASIDMASWFLPLGKPIVIEHYGDKKPNFIHRSRGYNVFNGKLKMVVLIDQGSASASEILAGALQENGIAKLVGKNTFGKGSVQELVHMSDNTSLKITIAKWLTPNGNSISDGGLKPDYEVNRTLKDRDEGRDPQMEKAIEILRSM